MVRSELNKVVEEQTVPLTSDPQRKRLMIDVQADVLGHGAAREAARGPDVTEIMVNGLDMIYVERAGQITRSRERFTSEEHLRQVIERSSPASAAASTSPRRSWTRAPGRRLPRQRRDPAASRQRLLADHPSSRVTRSRSTTSSASASPTPEMAGTAAGLCRRG